MSDSVPLPSTLSLPQNSGQQQVTVPKLLFLTNEKQIAISNKENSKDSLTNLPSSANQDMTSLKESPISQENESTQEDLVMSAKLAHKFEKVKELPGVSFLKDKTTHLTEPECVIILQHSALQMVKKMNFIT